MGWKGRIAKAWHDPVGSNVIAGLFLAALGAAWYVLKELGAVILSFPWGGVLSPIVERIAAILQTGVPLWYLWFAMLAWFVGRKLFRQWRTRMRLVVTEQASSPLASRTHRPAAAERMVHEGPVSSEILKQEMGSFSIWAMVTDDHNRMRSTTRYCYIIAHSGNNGEALGNPAMATYPNAWAIGRVLPTRDRPEGQWRFFCNAVEKPQTLITTKRLLSPGWRLFTLEWSKTDNFIRFHIDVDVVEEKPFANWPQHVTGNFTLGKWSSNVQGHVFNSEVGPVIMSKECLRAGELAMRLATRPSNKA
jgi:hypothetical protein